MNFYIKVYKNERWKEIPDSDGYFISNKGRVKSSDSITKQGKKISGQILSTNNLNSYGYPRCTIKMKDGSRKEYLIHRLVALAFIPNYNIENKDINHKDENKLNNDVKNLEWCNKKYNNNYGSRKEKVSFIQSDRYKLYDVHKKCYINNIFIGLKEIAKFLNISKTTASVYTNHIIKGYKIIRLTDNKHNYTLLKEEDLV